MSRFSRQCMLALCLVLVASAPLAGMPHDVSAPEPATVPEQPAQVGFWSPLWSYLTGLWSKNGCSISPFGGCGTGQSDTTSAPEESENGCSADPYGRCLPGH